MNTESLIHQLRTDEDNFRKLSFIHKGKYCVHRTGVIVSLNRDIPRIIDPVFSMPEGYSVVLYCPEPIRFNVANLVAHCFGLTTTLREKIFFEDGDMKNIDLDNLTTAEGRSSTENSVVGDDLHRDINVMLERHDSGLKELLISQEFIDHLQRLLDLIRHKIDRKQIAMAEVQLESLEKWFDDNWLNSKTRPTLLLKKELDERIESIPTVTAHDIIKQSVYQFFEL